MSEDKLRAAVSKGARAKALLNDDIISGALKTLEQSYIDAWLATHPRDQDARERLWTAVQVTRKFRDHLSIVVDDGKIAQAEIDAMAAREVKAA